MDGEGYTILATQPELLDIRKDGQSFFPPKQEPESSLVPT